MKNIQIIHDASNIIRNFYAKFIEWTFFLRRKVVKHTYCGFLLDIYISNPIGKLWYDQDWERDEIKFLRKYRLKKDACVFNIGAHQGIVATIFSKIVGNKGLVVAVEPDAHHVEVAEINKKNNNIPNLHIVHAAVAEKRGILLFGNDKIQFPSSKQRKIEIQATTVDDVSKQFRIPSLLYVDVEGYECNVLKGAKKTLQQYPDCCIEVHVGCGLENFNSSVEEIISHFPKDRYILYMAPATHECTIEPLNLKSKVMKDRFYLIAISKNPVT